LQPLVALHPNRKDASVRHQLSQFVVYVVHSLLQVLPPHSHSPPPAL